MLGFVSRDARSFRHHAGFSLGVGREIGFRATIRRVKRLQRLFLFLRRRDEKRAKTSEIAQRDDNEAMRALPP